jgi:hypothetical protein
MKYFFDFRDGDSLNEDKVGIEYADLKAAQLAATAGLADYARDIVPGNECLEITVEIRADRTPLAKARMVFESQRLQS